MSIPMLPRDARAGTKRRADYRAPPFVVDDVALEFDLDPDATRVTATFAFRRNPAAAAVDGRAPLVLDGEQQQRIGITLDGRPVAPERLTITPSTLTLLDPPDTGTLSIQSVIAPSRNVALEGLYVSSGVFCTQCEPEGFRRITCFPDRPDVLARYDVTLRANRLRYPQLLSNGNLVDAGPLDDGRHFARWRDPFPKPTYLFALVAGDLASLDDEFVTASGRRVALRIFATRANIGRCRHAMDSLKRAMRWDEERFGREYDLDTFMIFCADDFNLGAMENKGLNIFNSRLLLADAAMATDNDFSAIEAVIAHEYFHNWTGNRVTCRDWFQLSLKEGLTVYRDQEYSADEYSRPLARIQDVRTLREQQMPEDAGPMAHSVRPDSYVEVNNFYTATVYEKGAEVVRMYATLFGRQGFRKGMDLYFQRHDGQAVTCDDFRAAMASANGADLAQFERWYSQAGTPVVECRGEHDAAAQTYTLHLRQTCPPTPGQADKEPFVIPFAVGLVGSDGFDLPLAVANEGESRALRIERETNGAQTAILPFTQAEQRFVFKGVAEPPVPSLLRGFSAPVKVSYAYSDADLARLMAYDLDPFNRWEASQQLSCRILLAGVETIRAGKEMSLPASFAEAMGRVLTEGARDPAFAAECLELPSENYLAECMEVSDPDAIHAARMKVIRDIATRYRTRFEGAFRHFTVPGPYSPDAVAAGRRALRNAALGYVSSIDDATSRALAFLEFRRAANMTDAMAALMCLSNSAGAERERALAMFYDKWKDEALVVDKWFLIQARSWLPGTLDRVKALAAHPAFELKNPNRARSLLHTFAVDNPLHFHAADGSGYRWIAEQVVALDRLNPQVASRLARAFDRWKKYDAGRQAHARAALEMIRGAEGLSSNIAEVVGRALA